MYHCLLSILLFSFVEISYCTLKLQPEQVHLAYGNSIRDYVVTWSTMDKPQGVATVEYGIGGMILSATGTSELFVDGGPEKHSQYIHRVTLKDLEPNSKYLYHCGGDSGWSPEFWFKTPPEDEKHWQPHLAIYGDLGNENAQSLTRLQEETQREMYDAILHVGDFAYDMDWENGKVGDEFMKQIESVAAYLPYMTCPGNHEERYNFSNYRYRFSMPGGKDQPMFSFNVGPLHIISISTELYYFMNYGIKSLVNQYEWLENDLRKAVLPENRKNQPWIVVMGHRPMYCSDTDADDCSHHETLTRVGLPFLHMFGMEKLFYDYGVDLLIWAHEHSYERLFPVYDYKVYNGSYEHPYTNPKAPVHIVTGSAGCREKTDNFVKNPLEWSAFRSSDYGYTRLKAYNGTHLYIEQVSDDKQGMVIDSIWLIKDQHGFYEHSEMNLDTILKELNKHGNIL